MKLITRQTDYAVRTLCAIARENGEAVSAARTVKASGVPRPVLRKILHTLARKRVLSATRGAGGGYTLTQPPHRIMLTDLMRIFQGPVRLNECMFLKKACPRVKSCMLKKKLDSIEKTVVKELKTVSIASLMWED